MREREQGHENRDLSADRSAATRTRNQIRGEVRGPVVQTRDVSGGIHYHARPRHWPQMKPRIAISAAILTAGSLAILALVPGSIVRNQGASRLTATSASTDSSLQAHATTIYGADGIVTSDDHSRALTAALVNAHEFPAGVSVSPAADPYYGNHTLVFYRSFSTQSGYIYNAEATVTDAHGSGQLAIQVLQQPEGLTCTDAPNNWQPCQMIILPDGTHITSLRYSPDLDGTPGLGDQEVQWLVELVHPDGTAVDAQCDNESWDSKSVDMHPSGAEPPLDGDVLIALVSIAQLKP